MFTIMVFNHEFEHLLTIPVDENEHGSYIDMLDEEYVSSFDAKTSDQPRKELEKMITSVDDTMRIGLCNISKSQKQDLHLTVAVCFLSKGSDEFIQRAKDGFDGQIKIPEDSSGEIEISWTGKLGFDGTSVTESDYSAIVWKGELKPFSSEKE